MDRVTNVIERSGARESAFLRILAGPDAGQQCRLPAAGVGVGAAPTCDGVLRDPAVAAGHLAIAPAGIVDAGFEVEDLGSRNGIFLDGVRLGRAVVPLGASLCLGHTVLQLLPAERSRMVPPSAAQRFGDLIGRSMAMRGV